MDKKWDVFISHASEDKEKIVRELANLLTDIGLKVWYDEFSLKVGDSLTQKIDEGLLEANYGIVIISKHFLNKKWADYEYRSLLSREDNFKKILLPIWHDITYEEVKKFSLYLADKFALDTNKIPLRELAIKLIEVIRPDIFSNIQRMLLYKMQLKNAETKYAKPSDLNWGLKQRNSLSQSYLNRIKSFYFGIGINFKLTLEESIEGYLYDQHPEREIAIWEIMNATYLEFIRAENISLDTIKKDVASQLLMFSLGQISDKPSIPLNKLK